MLEFTNVIMEIIKDLRILKAIGSKYDLVFDKEFKYIINDYNSFLNIEYKGCKYDIKYFSGCFYPYLVKIN